jgi:hypothetical protein
MSYIKMDSISPSNRVKMRGNCSFCWYWCNYWPSVFILSFHKYLDNSGYYSILAYLIWQMLIYNPNYNSTYIYNYLVFVLYIDITGWYWIHFYIGHTLSISCVYNCSAQHQYQQNEQLPLILTRWTHSLNVS